MTDALLHRPATDLLRLLQRREVSAVELAKAAVAQLDAVDPSLRIAVERRTPDALDEARRIDGSRTAGAELGPLAGLPITVKDAFAVTGVVLHVGLRREGAAPEAADAEVVRRVRSAGAVVIATSNVPALLLSGETDNEVVGRTCNPYDPARHALGSSGGAAAGVASGVSAFELGSDIGGSIRGPAHACGIVGLKPTHGRVPRTGHALVDAVPPLGELTDVGPLTRTVADAALVLRVIEGPDGCDPDVAPGTPLAADALDERALAGTRLAVVATAGRRPVDAATTAALDAAATALEHVGARPDVQDLPGRADAQELWVQWVTADGGAGVRAAGRRLLAAPDEVELPAQVAWTQRDALPPERWHELGAAVRAFRRCALVWASSYDVVVLPALPGPAPLVGDRIDYSGLYAGNLLGWPIAVVRAGTSPEGLPVGVQVMSTPGRDGLVLAAAAAIEASTGGYVAPPAGS